MNYLYVYVKKGTKFKIGEELCEKQRLAINAHYMTLPNGDAVGKVVTANGLSRSILESVAGITVLPPAHRPLQQKHIDAFAGCQLKTPLAQGDTAYEFGEKLHDTHGLEWMHPDNWFIGGISASTDVPEYRLPDNEKGPVVIQWDPQAQKPSTPAAETSAAPA